MATHKVAYLTSTLRWKWCTDNEYSSGNKGLATADRIRGASELQLGAKDEANFGAKKKAGLLSENQMI